MERPEEALAPSWNVAPTKDVYAVLERAPRGEPDEPPRRRLQVARWGLVPSWAKDAVDRQPHDQRPDGDRGREAGVQEGVRQAAGLLPADGYYEWYGEVKGKKQPFFIRPADGGVLAMAGLYELWRDPSVPADADLDAWLWTVHRAHDHGRPTTSGGSTTGCRCWSSASGTPSGSTLRVDDPDELRGLLVPAAPGLLRRTRSRRPSTT